jgi:U3 small nucleolar RNA-associated protein MPP10
MPNFLFQTQANDLFKRICLKLDALSHFHFAPKPVCNGSLFENIVYLHLQFLAWRHALSFQVIEDMSIQANVPALAMEEVPDSFFFFSHEVTPLEYFI